MELSYILKWPWTMSLSTSGSSETCSSQLSIIKNRYLDTKISLLRCLGAELHLQVALDHVVGVHLAVLEPV